MRRLPAILALCCAPFCTDVAHAEDLAVPADLQSAMVSKIVRYDKNFPWHTTGKVTIAVVQNTHSVDSTRSAAQLLSALRKLPNVGGLPHEVVLLDWESPAALATACAARKLDIVYLTPGFSDSVEETAKALNGVTVLTVGSVVQYVERGAVLGFDAVSGHAKLVLNLTQAKRQGIALRAEVLHIMRIVK